MLPQIETSSTTMVGVNQKHVYIVGGLYRNIIAVLIFVKGCVLVYLY